jgi:hypothetical protein
MPDGWWMNVGLVAIMVGVGAIFTYYSDNATKKIKRYCVVAHFICMLVLAGNLGLHLGVVRDVSAFNEGQKNRNDQDDRRLNQIKELSKVQTDLYQSQKDLADAEARAARQDAIRADSYRRNGIAPPPVRRTAAPAPQVLGNIPEVKTEPEQQSETAGPKYKTLEDVYQSWRMALMIYSFIDAFTGIFFGGLLAARWEWDRNHDGINDKFQPQLWGKATA